MPSVSIRFKRTSSCPDLRRNSVLSPGHVKETCFVERPSSRMTQCKAMRQSLMNSVLKLNLDDTHCLQTEICESALLCLHFIQSKQSEKLNKLLSILLEIGEKRVRHKSLTRTPKSPQWGRSSMYFFGDQGNATKFRGGRASIAVISSVSRSPASKQQKRRTTYHAAASPLSKVGSKITPISKSPNKVKEDSDSTVNSMDIPQSNKVKENPGDFRKNVMNYPLSHGDTLVFHAIRQNMVDTMIDLICADSDVNHRNELGSTPLVTAISIPNNMECIIVLIAAGAVLSEVDFEKVNAFKHTTNQHLDLLKCVTIFGARNDAMIRRGSIIPKTPENRRGSAPINHLHNGQSPPPSSYKRRRGSMASCAGGWMEAVTESQLLGKIGYKRIQSIQKRTLFDRLHSAKKLAAELAVEEMVSGDQKNPWNTLLCDVLGFGKSDYHSQKAMKRNVRTNESLETTETVSEEENDDEDSSIDRDELLLAEDGITKMDQIGDAILFPRLQLYEMDAIPTQQRFDAGFGTEREQKGVRIITNTFRRLKFIQNAEEAADEAARRKIRFYSL